eukprot:6149468-Prymnesium_polylepis.2
MGRGPKIVNCPTGHRALRDRGYRTHSKCSRLDKAKTSNEASAKANANINCETTRESNPDSASTMCADRGSTSTAHGYFL